MTTNDDTSASKDEAVKAYESARPDYEDLCEEIADLAEEALVENNFEFAVVHARAKSVASFREKISRKEYKNPLVDMEDLAGVRIVCLYDEDRAKIAELCAREFEVVSTEDLGRNLGADRMGYNGTHLIVRLKPEYGGRRYRNIAGRKCEIQIRTAVQDAWAMISHGMAYKREEEVPLQLLRDLNHAAALLEIAQTKFDDLRQKRERYVREINSDAPVEHITLMDRTIDFDTLTAYIRAKFPGLPPDDKLTRMVIRDINRDRFTTIADIDRVVERAKPAVDSYRSAAPELFGNGTDFVTKSLGFGDPDFQRKHRFGGETRKAFPLFEHLILPTE
ncbi:hypothetical protein I6F11_17465 [Ensifer sp. NBAIM29]|nr:hypothetical protein [Ensifer sp. NBAIM29]